MLVLHGENWMNSETKITQVDIRALPTKGLEKAYASHFVGRDDVLDVINLSIKLLRKGMHHGLRFHGERGIGKSSLFDYLEDTHCEKFNILPIKINVEGTRYVADLLETTAREIREAAIRDFSLYKIRRYFWEISDTIEVSLGDKIRVKEKEKRHVENRKKELRKYFEALNEVGVEGILIMFDDADCLETSILGELGFIFNEELDGYISYISTGTYKFEDIEMVEDEDGVRVTDRLAGILAYWEQILLMKLSPDEMEALLNSYLAQNETHVLETAEKNILFSLSAGNGRLLTILTQMAGRFGIEIVDKKKHLRVTTEVVDKALIAAARLAPKLHDTFRNLEARDPNAIKPRWW